jgi:lipoprotein-anchoring transpeptidase ErfK/SrfK
MTPRANAAAALATLAASLIAMPALAGPPSRDDVNEAGFSEPTGKQISPVVLKAQVLLDRTRFSPGVIDGFLGDNFSTALKAFEQSQDLVPDGKLDPEVWAKLLGTSDQPVLVAYTITEEDVKGPFVDIPDKFENQSKLDRMAYTGPAEMIAERFHMDIDLLELLNEGKSLDRAGTEIVVADVRPGSDAGDPSIKGARIEARKGAGEVRLLDRDGKVLALYPASIGSEDKPAPSGTHRITAVVRNPDYTYNPEYRFKGVKAQQAFKIKPGPNNPVGTVWIDLSVESFGIHGTPEPSKVGKVASHGCVRLTNWDVEELAARLNKGMPIDFVD